MGSNRSLQSKEGLTQAGTADDKVPRPLGQGLHIHCQSLGQADAKGAVARSNAKQLQGAGVMNR